MPLSKEEAVNEVFCLGDFQGFLDEIERERGQRKASEKEMKSVMEHLGGFEYWPLLINDCKKVIAEFLDYDTLRKLGMCSKADNDLVSKTLYQLHSIEIHDNESFNWEHSSEEFENVTVSVKFHKDFNSGKHFNMVFSEAGENTEVRWIHYFPKKRPEKRSMVIEESNYYEEAVKFADKLMEKSQFRIKKIVVEMSKYPFATSKIKSLPKCTDVRIGADDVETFRWWLQKVPEQLDNVQLIPLNEDRDSFTLPSDLLSLPQVMNAKSLFIWCRASFTDEQFLSLKAMKISFNAVNITDEGVHEFLKKWVNGEAVDGLEQALLWAYKVSDQSRVMRGLDVRPWDPDFQVEARGFCLDFERCCGRGESFQISSRVEPLDSLSLSFLGDSIFILATGKKCSSNGRTYTSYGIP